MLMGQAVGQGLGFQPADAPQALHPSELFLDGAEVLGNGTDVLKARSMRYDITLPIMPTPSAHRAAFLTHFLTQGPPIDLPWDVMPVLAVSSETQPLVWFNRSNPQRLNGF
jgi:hypothetical protein